MRSLLDVNVLIALLDADHASHEHALRWFKRSAREGWASCPLTQNGCVRIMSHPRYPSPVSVRDCMRGCAKPCRANIRFWPDDPACIDQRVPTQVGSTARDS